MSLNLTAPVESAETRYTVSEINDQGAAVLTAPSTAKGRLSLQIGQLWETHNNFTGLSDGDGDSESDNGDSIIPDTVTDTAAPVSDADLDAYAVRAKVHDSLTMAQSEIQVSLDI
ncbi:hypothetical protein LPJ57_006352, partial [Coemansia sp. RSA 486]